MSLKNQLVSVRAKVAMLSAFLVVLSLVLPSSSFINRLALRTVLADNTPQTLPFSQAWTNTGLITANDNWSGVPGIEGFFLNSTNSTTGIDPQTVLTDVFNGAATTVDLDVIANQTATSITNGGVAEFHTTSQAGAPGANPTIALQGSGTADAPFILLHLNTTGQTGINVAYNVRDIDCTADDAVQPVALQFRVGNTGSYTNVPAGFVADGSTGPSICTAVTAVSATLPAAADNQPLVQVRILTTNAVGNDEWVGIDDISVTTGGGGGTTLSIGDVTQAETNAGTTNFNFLVSLSAPAGAGGVTFNATTADGTATTADSDYVGFTNQPFSITSGNTSTTVTVVVNGDPTPEPNETFFVNITSIVGATGSDVQGQGTITNDDFTLTPIHTIQGNGSTSPLAASAVTTSGIVTGLRTNGFYIQEPDASVDADPNTSEGIFVFTSSAPPAAAVIGNMVSVGGTVQEFIPAADPFSPPLTEIITPTVGLLTTGNPLPVPITITASETTQASETANPLDSLEEYEGMRVTVGSLTVSGPTQGTINEPAATVTSSGVFLGVVTGVARPFREAGIAISDPLPSGAPGTIPRFDENPERIRVDSDAQPGTTAIDVAAGTVITNITGPLDFAFRTYTICPDLATPPVVGAQPGSTAVPVPTANEFTVVSFNMERFFDTVNDPGIGEPVLTAAAFNRRLAKASLIIRTVERYPDVIGVEEMENLSTLQAVAAQVNADAVSIDALPNPNYTAYLSEGNDPGGIDVGFLVKQSRISVVDVTQFGLTTTYTNPDMSTSIMNDRPPLVLRATCPRPLGGVLPFTVIVNHLRSLNGVDDTGPGSNGFPTEGERVRFKRRAQAEFLANLIQTRQTSDPTELIITLGDMNAFAVNDGYVDSIGTIKGTPAPASQVTLASSDLVNPDLTNLLDFLPAAQQYSYNFDGNAQTLDHILVNRKALPFVTRFAYARNDSDFAVKNYESTNELRISDHDQPVAYFNLALAPTAADGRISGRITDPNGVPIAGAVVNLAGAQTRQFITDANGNYTFENVETAAFYTVTPSRVNYSFSPASRSFNQLGNHTEAVFTGSLASASENPIDTPEFFVRQHYLDFLGREPDESGFNFWSGELRGCGRDGNCYERRRINVSAAYFVSIEFQHLGGMVDGLYRASYGRRPLYAEFGPDLQIVGRGVVVGQGDWLRQMNENKRAFVANWVARDAFRATYDGLSDGQFVDTLIRHTGVTFASGERDALVSGLDAGTLARADVLRRIVEDDRFMCAKLNEMFVMMEYFGYLRRDPDEAGFRFWLNKLNEFHGNFEDAEMVKAFITSGEYRQRFIH